MNCISLFPAVITLATWIIGHLLDTQFMREKLKVMACELHSSRG